MLQGDFWQFGAQVIYTKQLSWTNNSTKYANETYVITAIALLDVTLASRADTCRLSDPCFGGILLFLLLHETEQSLFPIARFNQSPVSGALCGIRILLQYSLGKRQWTG